MIDVKAAATKVSQQAKELSDLVKDLHQVGVDVTAERIRRWKERTTDVLRGVAPDEAERFHRLNPSASFVSRDRSQDLLRTCDKYAAFLVGLGEEVAKYPERLRASQLLAAPSAVSAPAGTPMSMKSLFLSHSSKDKFFARELAARLQAQGIHVWIDEAEIRVGDSLTSKISEAIQEKDYFGVVLSGNSVASEWVTKELQAAIQRELTEKRIVVLPILLERVEMPVFLRDKRYADFTSPDRFESSLADLLKALGREPPIPYVGESVSVKATPAQVRVTAPLVQVVNSLDLSEFTDLRIMELDTSKSYRPDDKLELYNMYLRLSGTPPADWVAIFDAERKFPRHAMWRRAWAEGQYIIVHCVPGELETYHLKDLKQDIAAANGKYRQNLLDMAQRAASKTAMKHQERESLDSLRRRLDFT